ncbi:MAG: DUF222 domain-containing protein [Acidobacteria bacterium]|nr:DUF222 domain-containing protein [Acidobacteriota bacterium]
MLDLNDSDASATSTLSATHALPHGPALLTSQESSQPPLAGDSTASEADLDIPPLDPIIDPIAHRRAEVERLGERIAELSSRIQAATYDLLVLIREFDAQIGWSGWTSCAHWLSWRTGLAPGVAREHVRVARALGNLPKLSDAMRRGAVSYSKVRAVTRVATPETEQALLDVAQSGTAAHVEQIVRGWRRVDRTAERTEEKQRQDRRSLRTWVDEDGMVVVQGRLTPEVGAALRRALEAACDKARPAVVDSGGADAEAFDVALAEEELAPTFAQRQADAIGVVAECALAGGLDRGTAGDRYQVVVHVDGGALADERDVPAGMPETAVCDDEPTEVGEHVPAGTYKRAELAPELDEGRQDVPAGTPAPASAPAAQSQTVLDEAGGIHVSAETARRLACDSAKVEMLHGPDGEILGVGRRTRTISPALRRALAARDGQCRFPGCQNRRCDAHHVQHWADGGETTLDNLVLLCRRHHRAVHEEGFRIALDATGEVEFIRPDGRPFPAAPPPPPWSGAALAPVTERLEQEGVGIDSRTAVPAWKGKRVDIGWAVDLLWRPRPDAPSAHTHS